MDTSKQTAGEKGGAANKDMEQDMLSLQLAGC